DGHVPLGEAKLDAKGSLGRAGDALDIEPHAPNLSVIAKPLGWNAAGSVDAQARLTGALSALAGRVSLKAANLELPGEIFARELDLRGEAGREASSAIHGTVESQA